MCWSSRTVGFAFCVKTFSSRINLLRCARLDMRDLKLITAMVSRIDVQEACMAY